MNKYIIVCLSIFCSLLTFGAYADDLAKKIIQEAESYEASGNLLDALSRYNKAFEEVADPDILEEINSRIEDLNIKLLFSKTIDKSSIEYKVVSGDSLSKIAKKYNTTVELIKRSNSLNSDLIRIGQRLKLPNAKFSIFVDKSQNVLFLKRGMEILKTYRVATGANNSTPVGEYKIVTKLKDPVHYRRDIKAVIGANNDKNLIGTRWMGFDIPSYGIHGHAVPEDLGKQVTKGCVRMLNNEVEELFIIVPRKTTVTIVD